MSQREKDAVFFAVWLLGSIAEAWKCTPHEAYALLQKERIVDEYILPFYDVLHTMGREALVEDINVIAREKGVLA